MSRRKKGRKQDFMKRYLMPENFGKSINNAGWHMFANMLCYKAEKAGCRVVSVNPKHRNAAIAEL
ncbi:MAG: zinc ribbon domain-containing protein [Candidatus Micrarchaeia archaeon]